MSWRCTERQKKDLIPFSRVVVTHCWFVNEDELILSMYIRSIINNIFLAVCSCLVGLWQLYTRQLCTYMQLTKAYEAETACNETVIDSATYKLRINSSWSHSSVCCSARCSLHSGSLVSHAAYPFIVSRILHIQWQLQLSPSSWSKITCSINISLCYI